MDGSVGGFLDDGASGFSMSISTNSDSEPKAAMAGLGTKEGSRVMT